MLMVLVDATDALAEFQRKISATQREINSRYLGEEDVDILDQRKIMCVLTKIENISETELMARQSIVREHGYGQPLGISVHENIGLNELQDAMLAQLFGSPTTLQLTYNEAGRGIEGYLSDVYESGMIIDKELQDNGDMIVEVWINKQSLARLVSNSGGRIEVK
jgi:50S ribosomal subunit-associated GTPase HflX